MELETRSSPSVIPSSEIPISAAPEEGGLEVRPFLAHRLLERMMPRSNVTLAWSHARADSEVKLRKHALPSLLIILEGRAELVGAVNGEIERGDVVTVPAGSEYGFTAIGPLGLQVLHVAFDQSAIGELEEVTLEELLQHNRVRGQFLLNNPFFHLLRCGRPEHPTERATMRECLRVFADAFQVSLHTRQATCRDEHYWAPFLAQLREEIGRNELLEVTGNAHVAGDAILRSTSLWFCHQMLVLDNAGKAAVSMVLETAGQHLATFARPVFAGEACEHYFDTHANADAQHKEVGAALLADQHSDTYRRLFGVVDEAWDMLDAMTRRVVDLIERESTSA